MNKLRAASWMIHQFLLPLNHTQRELEPNVFELTLVPALDFEIYMRRYLTTTWEVVDAILC